jgi:hypothetical protein
VIGSIAAAFGALASAIGPLLDAVTPLGSAGATRVLFAGYAALGLATAAVVARLGQDAELPAGSPSGGLGPSRRRVWGLSGLFALDSFAGGLVVQSVIALFFLRKFDLDPAVIGAVFFGTSIFAALSFLASARLATRFGLVNTMVFTHLPSNVLLVGVAVSPVAWLAVAFLFARSMLSQMDVPPRQALIVSVVEPANEPPPLPPPDWHEASVRCPLRRSVERCSGLRGSALHRLRCHEVHLRPAPPRVLRPHRAPLLTVPRRLSPP